MNGRGKSFGIVAALAVAGTLAVAPAANAATWNVTSLADSGANTLRQAMIDSNDGGGVADTINLNVSGQIVLATSLPSVGPVATYGVLTINGPGATQLDVHRNAAAGPFMPLGVVAGGFAIFNDFKISGGQSPTSGGGIFNSGNLTLNRVEVTGNTAPSGGGGINSSIGSVLTVRQSAITGNSDDTIGGGGIASSGTLNIDRSTISGNSTDSLAAGGIRVTGTATITESTIADNTGDNTTSTAKNLSVDGGGASATLSSTILADPRTPSMGPGMNCAFGGGGNIVSSGFNLADDASCNLVQATDRPSLDPGLAALALNSGQTRTQAIDKASPAADRGNSTSSVDQRGLTRPVDFADVANAVGGDGTDIGAFEFQVPVPTIPQDPATTAPTKKKCKKGQKLKKGKCVKKKRKKKRK